MRCQRFLGRRAAVDGPIAIALEGEAGIGKSTLWRAAVAEASERGLRVLVARAAESERTLAHAGLGDLFDGVLDDVLPRLSAPRRRALEVALLVEDADGRPVDPRALGVAVRSALELLSEDGLVIAIDDLQWLDASSASALGFALRRLDDVGRRPRLDAAPRRAWVERRRGARRRADRASRRRAAQHRRNAPDLAVALPHGVPRPTLLRLHEASGGNPFYALELGRALAADGAERDPTQPLRVPKRLEELVADRLDGFTGATREALTLASADARLTPALLAGAGIATQALEPALAEHVLELADGAVRFTHPLLASVLYQGLAAPSGSTCTAGWPRWWGIRSLARATWHSPPTSPTPSSRHCSRLRPGRRPRRARRWPPPSWASTPSA